LKTGSFFILPTTILPYFTRIPEKFKKIMQQNATSRVYIYEGTVVAAKLKTSGVAPLYENSIGEMIWKK